MRKIRKIVVPIAGHGTRCFPASKVIPKALFPIFDPSTGLLKPLLMCILEEGVNSLSVDPKEIEIGIIISPSQEPLMRQFFKDPILESYKSKDFLREGVKQLEYISERITFIVQKEQRGFGHAIGCAEKFVGNDPFIMFLGDLLYTSYLRDKACAKQLVEIFENPKFFSYDFVYSATFFGKKKLKNTGILKGDIIDVEKGIIDVSDTFEKPTFEHAKSNGYIIDQKIVTEKFLPMQKKKDNGEGPYFCSYFGFDIFSPKIFEALKYVEKEGITTQGEINLRDAQKALIKKFGCKTLAYVVRGSFNDCGLPNPFVSTLNFYKESKIVE